MVEENKQIVRTVTEQMWNYGNLDVADQYFSADCRHPVPPRAGVSDGPDGFKQIVASQRAAFPDLQYTIEDEIAEGDRVVIRWTARGTHEGPILGVEATGKKVAFTGIMIARIENGEIVQYWAENDVLGLMDQIRG